MYCGVSAHQCWAFLHHQDSCCFHVCRNAFYLQPQCIATDVCVIFFPCCCLPCPQCTSRVSQPAVQLVLGTACPSAPGGILPWCQSRKADGILLLSGRNGEGGKKSRGKAHLPLCCHSVPASLSKHKGRAKEESNREESGGFCFQPFETRSQDIWRGSSALRVERIAG